MSAGPTNRLGAADGNGTPSGANGANGTSNGARLHAPAPAAPPRAATDVIELAEIGRALRRGARGIAGAALLGVAIAAALLAYGPRRFAGGATVLLRSGSDAGGSLLSRLGVPAELAPAGLGAAMKSPMETELQIVGSRAVLGAVSDSLGLQVRVLAPGGVPPWRLLAPRPYPGSFRKVALRFEVAGAGRYRVTGRDVDGEVAQGRPLRTPYGELALALGALPPRFEVQLLDREDALERLADRVGVEKAGGEVARVGYGAPDSLSAAAVPNAIIAQYLERRRTTDRGVNEHRAEFLEAQVDSVARQLADAERALRRYQEQSRVVDPEIAGKIDLEAASRVREQLAANQVEGTALDQLLRQVADGSMSARQLAAYPSFLRSPGVNEILGQLATLETELATLRERRTEADPEVAALRTRAQELEQQLQPLGTAYAQSLARQRRELESQSARFDASLAALPGAAEAFARYSREVRRLGQTSLALQTQLLDARLAAIGEGGDVRQVDVALVPKKPVFPRPSIVLPAGLLGGLLIGVVGALAVGFLSPRLHSAEEAGRLLGVPAARLGDGRPLFFATIARVGHGAVVPLDDEGLAVEVARWLGSPTPARQTMPTRDRVLAPALAGDAPADGADADVFDARAAAPAEGFAALPPLSSGAAVAARLAHGTPVVLALRAGAARADVEEGVAALRLAGGDLVACVVG
jgi:tyrosine-protein kinase Etk/Wzc